MIAKEIVALHEEIETLKAKNEVLIEALEVAANRIKTLLELREFDRLRIGKLESIIARMDNADRRSM